MEIICYLSNGYPTIEASYNMAVEYADAGCRMMEVDFPSRNPYLESDYIAGRMKKALEACDDYEKYMDSIVAIQKRLPDVKILVLAYENTVEEIGVDRFIEFCLTNNLKDITKRADILIVAIGRKQFITADYVKEGAVVIDVGIHRNEENKLCGDVDFDSVEPVCSAITPVPGGVGPMTIAMLMNNCLESVSLQAVRG